MEEREIEGVGDREGGKEVEGGGGREVEGGGRARGRNGGREN